MSATMAPPGGMASNGPGTPAGAPGADDDLPYPIADKRPDLVRTANGLGLDALTVEAVVAGKIAREDIAITPEALRLQADIARRVGRDRLAENFERAAELARVPEDELMAVYELLRPGRATGPEPLLDAAAKLRRDYAADRVAALVEEAADVYVRRGLFTRRF
ncbi:diol dehydratase small subunit [Pseudoxanthobacter sp. M-2]|uniref:diol dehydratase small subunit n=1 Tax=Pseudoxanthobacter sp. M-2 TaxID=3078754 RepID=UPI0038FCA42F